MPSWSAPASRALPAYSCASSAAGARPRGRRRRRRHLVLESLSRRALRFRELDLRLFVLEGAARRVGLAGALRPPARDRTLPQLRRRQVRPPPRHPVRLPRRGRALPRGDTELGPGWKTAAAIRRGFWSPRSAPSAPTMPNIPGIDTFKGTSCHTIAGPRTASISPASGSASSAPARPPCRRSRSSPRPSAA